MADQLTKQKYLADKKNKKPNQQLAMLIGLWETKFGDFRHKAYPLMHSLYVCTKISCFINSASDGMPGLLNLPAILKDMKDY